MLFLTKENHLLSVVETDLKDKKDKQKRLAWSIACEVCVVTKEDPVLIYERMIDQFQGADAMNNTVLNESYKSC